jgi:hypothetical protein
MAIACQLALNIAPAMAEGQYLLTGPGDGGQLQVGRDWAIPLQTPVPSGIFPPVSGGFPPALGVPPIPGITPANATTAIAQQASGTLTIPPRILSRPAPSVPVKRAMFATNPIFFQAATSLSVRWPAATAVFMPGGGPGPALFGSEIGAVIAYSGGVRAFGGAAPFAISAGPGAAGRVIPGQAVTFHANFMGQTAATAATQALLLARNATLLQPGASLAAPAVGTPGVSVDPAIVSGSFGPFGTVLTSVPCATCPGFSNRLTWSKGFPWTTGFITIDVPEARPPEIFFLSGTDMRVAGVGNVSLVSGGYALRTLTRAAATIGWVSLTLPEPDAALAATAALATLAACHLRIRRKQRPRA